jgi:hypothetical protein
VNEITSFFIRIVSEELMAIIIFFMVAIHLHKSAVVKNGRRLSRLMRSANWFLVGMVYVLDVALQNDWLVGVSSDELPPLFIRALFRLTFLLLVIGEISYYGDAVSDIALSTSNSLKKVANSARSIWNRLIH